MSRAEAKAEPTYEDKCHSALTAAAHDHGGTDPVLRGRTSVHKLAKTATFTAVDAVLRAAAHLKDDAHAESTVRVVISKGTLLCSVAIGAPVDAVETNGAECATPSTPSPRPPPPPPLSVAPPMPPKKRKRDSPELALADRVQSSIDAVAKLGTISQEELQAAESLLTRAVFDLRGACGESAIESVGIFSRRLGSATADRLVLALRIAPGVAVNVQTLKRTFGSCWADGLFSAEEEVMGVSLADVPASAEGRLAMDWGNVPMLVVTAIPRPTTPPANGSTPAAAPTAA